MARTLATSVRREKIRIPARLPEIVSPASTKLYRGMSTEKEGLFPIESKQMTETVRRLAGNTKHILEVGCGNGEFARYLAAEFPDSKIIAEDIDPVAIRIAKGKNAAPNVEYRVGDVYSLASRHRRVDCVILKDCIHHFDSLDKALEQIFIVLKTEGTILGWDVGREYFYKDIYPQPHKKSVRACADILKRKREKSDGEVTRYVQEKGELAVAAMSYMAGYTAYELGHALQRVGFDGVEVFREGNGHLIWGVKPKKGEEGKICLWPIF